MSTRKITAAIVGGTGYTGVELIRLLLGHPGAELVAVTSRGESGRRLDALFGNLRGRTALTFSEPDPARLAEADVVFFATPNGIAMQQVPDLLARGTRVIDLAADFRIRDVAVWQTWYGMTHACPDLLKQAVYGLPEIHREQIRDARLVANPGCYPTAVQLGFKPLLSAGKVDFSSLIADTKSGVSGAGRKADTALLLAEVSESFRAYAVPGHRHLPEISQGLSAMAGEDVGLTFVPHLVPMIRGIQATLYAQLTGEAGDLQALYEKEYEAEPFVDVMAEGSHPETRTVRGNNTCRISVHRPQGGDRVVVLSVIDNLVKGAAGQAVQNMNIMFGLDETAGLDLMAVMP